MCNNCRYSNVIVVWDETRPSTDSAIQFLVVVDPGSEVADSTVDGRILNETS